MPVFNAGRPPDKEDIEEGLCVITKTISTYDLPTNNAPVLTPISSTHLFCEQIENPALVDLRGSLIVVEVLQFAADLEGL